MALSSRLHAFNTFEILIVLLILAILATLAFPHLIIGRESLCVQHIKHSTQLLSSNFSKTQTKKFLLHETQSPPKLANLAKELELNQTGCKLWLEAEKLHFQAGEKRGYFTFERIAESYQLRCNGDCAKLH